MVNQRCEGVHEQDGEHHTLGIAGVEKPDSNAESSYQESVDPLAAFGLSRGDGVCGHEYGSECEATHDELDVSGNIGNSESGSEPADEEGADHGRGHDLPTGNSGPEEDEGADKDCDH